MSQIKPKPNLQDKYDALIEIVEKRKTVIQTAIDLKIARNTVYDWVRGKDKIFEQYKTRPGTAQRVKVSTRPQVDIALLEWFNETRTEDDKISWPIMVDKANHFAKQFNIPATCDSNYIRRWGQRHSIQLKLNKGKDGYRIKDSFIKDSVYSMKDSGVVTGCLPEVTVNLVTVQEWFAKLQGICASYRDEDIFTTDETGLYYQLQPGDTPKFSNEKCVGGRHSDIRATVLLTASVAGEKLMPLFIGKYSNPNRFRNINRKNLGLIYRSNNESWMSSQIFNEWLKNIDGQFRSANRHVILFADTLSSHTITSTLTNVKVEFYPQNCTYLVHPMDQGITAIFKQFYRSSVIKSLVNNLDSQSNTMIDIKDAVDRTVYAWDLVKPKTITNCFVKAGHPLKTLHQIFAEELPTIKSAVWSRIDPMCTISYQDYIGVDLELATSYTITDEPISNAIVSDLVDEPESIPYQGVPTFSKVQHSIAQIRLYLQSQTKDTNKLLSQLAQIELEVDKLGNNNMIQASNVIAPVNVIQSANVSQKIIDNPPDNSSELASCDSWMNNSIFF